MSVTAPDQRITTYNPVVATTEFAALFPVFDNDDLSVFLDGEERTDFAVSATYVEGVSSNAKVTFVNGLVGKVEVVGNREPHRTNRFGFGPIPVRDLNLAFDTVESEVQEARRDVDRSHKAPFGQEGGVFSADQIASAQAYAEAAQEAADSAADSLGEFNSKYLGAFANDAAATAAAGGNPIEGAEYWNSTTGTRRVWHSGGWVNLSVAIIDGDVTETKLSSTLAVPRVFSTFAAAQAFTPLFTPDFITTAGYLAPGDFGGARYKLVAAEPTHAGKLSITLLGGGGVKWYELAEPSVTPQMFGAVADATNIGVGTDATAAIEACLAYWKTHNVEMALYGSYRYNPTGAWNLTGVNRGARIRGRSKNLDGFFLDTGKGLAIEGDNNFYLHLEEFRVFANVVGPALRIGKNDFSDAFNGCRFVLTVNNNSLDVGCSGLCLNYVLASDFFCTVNCGGTGRPTLEGGGANPNAPGKGKVLWLRQASFNRFMVAVGQGNIGICVETGFSFSNQFDAIDVEEVGVGVAVFSPSAARNLFVSGQYVGSTVINCADGNATVFGKACNLSPYAGGVVFSGRVGLEIETGGRQNHITNPAIPASGAIVQNTTASKVLVHIWAGNVSNIVITAKDGGAVSINPQVVGEGNDLVLHPNWSVTLTYTVAPNWRWFPL